MYITQYTLFTILRNTLNDTFVHELLHSVMNMNKQSMDNGVVHSKTGVIEDSITIEDGKIIKDVRN